MSVELADPCRARAGRGEHSHIRHDTTVPAQPRACAAALGPSAYGIAAYGTLALDGEPWATWGAGPPVVDTSPGVRAGPVSVGLMAVAAAQHYAAANIADLRYGDTVAIAALAVICVDGRAAVTVTGTIDGVALRDGLRITLPGGYAEIGARTPHPDGGVTVAGLTLAVDGELLQAAVAHG